MGRPVVAYDRLASVSARPNDATTTPNSQSTLRGVRVSDTIRRPYVYSVKARDVDGLREAVHAALTHPIKSYIPDNMSFKFVTDRLHDLVEGDWRGKAQAILIERLHSGWGEVSAGRSTSLAWP